MYVRLRTKMTILNEKMDSRKFHLYAYKFQSTLLLLTAKISKLALKFIGSANPILIDMIQSESKCNE